MEIISVIGMVLGVAVLIYLTFKGVNGFVASLVGSVIVIVSSGLPFWGTLTGTYAASLGSTFGSYLFLFTIGSAYSELMKKSGAAESIANFLFAFLGVKATVAGTLIITFLLAYGGVNAFIIIFARLSRGCAHVPQSQCLKTPVPCHLPVWSRGSECRYPGRPLYAVHRIVRKAGRHHLCGPHDGNCAPCSGFRLRHFLLHLGLQLPACPWNWLCSL